MKINKYLLLIATVLISVSLLVGVFLYFDSEETVEAQSVVSYQTITLEDGTTPYSATTYSDATLVGYYGLIQLQAYGEMTTAMSSLNFTVTAQFSNEPVACASVDATTGWFNAREYVPYVDQSSTVIASGEETVTVTSTVTSGVLTMGVLTPTMILSNTVMAREIETLGRCFRVRMEGHALFTPTVHIRLVNRQ